MFDKAGHMVDALVDMTAGVSETIDLGKSSLFVFCFLVVFFLNADFNVNIQVAHGENRSK